MPTLSERAKANQNEKAHITDHQRVFTTTITTDFVSVYCAQNMDTPTTYARETTKEIKKNIYIFKFMLYGELAFLRSFHGILRRRR